MGAGARLHPSTIAVAPVGAVDPDVVAMLVPAIREAFGAARFERRAVTEAVHELGHTYGLSHCDDPRCVMWFSNTLAESDRKGPTFCEVHARALLEARR